MSRFENKLAEPFTQENTTILMVDYSVGFANIYRSHTFNDNNRQAVALAKTALGFNTGFVFNLGAGQHTIQIKVLGTKNKLSKGKNVVVDAFGGPITTAGTAVAVHPSEEDNSGNDSVWLLGLLPEGGAHRAQGPAREDCCEFDK